MDTLSNISVKQDIFPDFFNQAWFSSNETPPSCGIQKIDIVAMLSAGYPWSFYNLEKGLRTRHDKFSLLYMLLRYHLLN
jgi:hypothetical protein